ncbi:BTB/POZ and MATH domain-containing protein 1-like [Triticum dicoccoides]|uniref:BTB/POZ and MATH domain-containing protein 1-like n=1 Tax=Triticum dicoccoides TaxID=85692 RepID=UPI001891E9E2|nr:BTB/POZ and MATH domain-containing protein 1-like [Triticum dicoccoides]
MDACAKTVSTCTPRETAQGTRVFDILDYSKLRGMGNDSDSYIRSGIFDVGGHEWAIRFYPDGLRSSVHKTGPKIFSYDDFNSFAPRIPYFKRRSEIEGSPYLKDDRLMIECVVTVFKKSQITKTKQFPMIDMPPSDMIEHVGRLLEEKEGFDVSFIVGGETIEAHRFVLAMRSPVLRDLACIQSHDLKSWILTLLE